MRREITSLALVKAIYAQFEFKRDYIENFIPFIANLVRKQNINSITLAKLDDFINIFRKEFGLNIPYHPMLTILERCRKRGLFRREYGQLFVISDEAQKYDFSDLVTEKEAKINELFQDISDYVKNKFSLVVSKDEVQNALLSYLSLHDMDIIFATQGEAVIPIVKSAPNLKYMLASYVALVKDSNAAMFGLIVEVAVGHILANTILYADKLQKYTGKFKGMYFYIDARFIFRLLGYEGDLFKNAYIELLGALKEQWVELCIFNHTFEEIVGVLKGAIRWVDTAEYDPIKASNVMRFYRNAGKNKADIQHDLATIDDKIKEFGICVTSVPDFVKSKERQIDEKELEKSIVTVYSARSLDFDPADKQYTIEKDIRSIASIYHLRQIYHPLTIKQAQYFFLTSNSGLAYASHCYEMKDSEGEKFIPACVTDVFVGTLVWMQSPVRWVEINQKRFLADCMALLNPSPLFIKKLIDEAQKLKDAGRLNSDEFMVVRSSIYVQQALMRETCGDADSINAESIEDVINRIRCEAAAPLEAQIKQKDIEVMELQKRTQTTEKEKQEYKNKLEGIAIIDARNFTNTISLGLWLLFIIALSVSFIDRIFWVKRALQVLSACFAIVSFGFGRNIKNIRETVFSYRLSKMRRKYGISD